jgi:Fe-S-cluster containining protein
MTVKIPDSVEKNMKQISVVAQHPFTFEGTLYTPPKSVKVATSFWRKYGCYLKCGACCLTRITLDYLPYEWDMFVERYPQHEAKGVARLVTVNGRQQQVYTIANTNGGEAHGKQYCEMLDMTTGACTIHEENPFSCRIELIKFRIMHDLGYVMKAPFGRAFNMRRVVDVPEDEQAVLCDFSEFSEEQFYRNDLPRLRQMQTWARTFGIDTYLPDMIRMMELCVERRQLKEITFP